MPFAHIWLPYLYRGDPLEHNVCIVANLIKFIYKKFQHCQSITTFCTIFIYFCFWMRCLTGLSRISFETDSQKYFFHSTTSYIIAHDQTNKALCGQIESTSLKISKVQDSTFVIVRPFSSFVEIVELFLLTSWLRSWPAPTESTSAGESGLKCPQHRGWYWSYMLVAMHPVPWGNQGSMSCCKRVLHINNLNQSQRSKCWPVGISHQVSRFMRNIIATHAKSVHGGFLSQIRSFFPGRRSCWSSKMEPFKSSDLTSRGLFDMV